MRLFEIKTPDGRYIRHEHESADAARLVLQPGYVLAGEVIGAYGDARGGFVESVAPGARPVLGLLLDNAGDALKAWLDANGYKKVTK
jgi:hypothetical protein